MHSSERNRNSIFRRMKITYVDSSEDLSQVAKHLSGKERIALDLEFDKNRFQYGFTMCLMQLFDGEECFIIDPLSDQLDIDVVFPVIEDPEIAVLGFELGEDLRLLANMGCSPRNIYDVSIASKLLNFGQISLVNAIEQILNRSTSKGAQKSNWIKRPLSADQLNYAAEDVVHLFDFVDALTPKLEARSMVEWVEQERKQLEGVEATEQTIESYIKSKDGHGYSEHEWFVFLGLLEFRERLAEQLNRPAYQVMDKDYLLALAKDHRALARFGKDARAIRVSSARDLKQRLEKELNRLEAEASQEGMDPNTPALPKQDRDVIRQAREKKKREDQLIKSKLKPIQASIKETYGDEAAVFILGNRLMRELAIGITDQLLPYKAELLEQHAEKAGVDLATLGYEKLT